MGTVLLPPPPPEPEEEKAVPKPTKEESEAIDYGILKAVNELRGKGYDDTTIGERLEELGLAGRPPGTQKAVNHIVQTLRDLELDCSAHGSWISAMTGR